jgi:hypothetical protein
MARWAGIVVIIPAGGRRVRRSWRVCAWTRRAPRAANAFAAAAPDRFATGEAEEAVEPIGTSVQHAVATAHDPQWCLPASSRYGAMNAIKSSALPGGISSSIFFW